MPPYFLSQARLFSCTNWLCMELSGLFVVGQAEKITLRVLRVRRVVRLRGFDLAKGMDFSDPNVAVLGRERGGLVELGLQTVGDEVFFVALHPILAVSEVLQIGPNLRRSQT